MTSPAVPILFGGLIAWSFYRRVRRNIGRQKLHPGRFSFTLVALSLASGFMIYASRQNPHLLLGFGGGLLPGVLLGWLGLRLTKFETTGAGRFYKPDTRLGVAISLLLIGRLIYRFWALRNVSYALNHPPAMRSPLTFFVVSLSFGYYLVYSAGLLIHARDQGPA